MNGEEPSLHRALLGDHYELLRTLASEEDPSQINWLGFTALELAQLLDKKEGMRILNPNYSKTISILQEGDASPIDYALKRFQKVFGVKYLPTLVFEDYDELIKVIRNCPLVLRTSIGKENRELGEKYRLEISQGYVADLTIKWIDPSIGYGVFANKPLEKGVYVGEYTGLVRQLYRFQPDHNAYCFHYPTKFWSWEYYMIDALWQGNELRFLNHHEQPNLEPACLVDRGLLHMVFFTNQEVPAGTELTFNYGSDYWRHKRKRT